MSSHWSLHPFSSAGPPRGPDPTVRPPEIETPGVWIDRGPALPAGYRRDRLVALVRDPEMIFFYWMSDGGAWETAVRDATARPDPRTTTVLRVFDLSAGETREIEILPGATHWYVEARPATRYRGELGIRDSAGEWRRVLESNPVETPPAGPSDLTDEEWYVSPEEFARLLGILEFGRPGQYDKKYPTS